MKTSKMTRFASCARKLLYISISYARLMAGKLYALEHLIRCLKTNLVKNLIVKLLAMTNNYTLIFLDALGWCRICIGHRTWCCNSIFHIQYRREWNTIDATLCERCILHRTLCSIMNVTGIYDENAGSQFQCMNKRQF